MKYIFTLLILISSFGNSSPIPSHMLEKTPLQLNFIFSKTNNILQRDIRIERGSREARKCRFYLREMPRTRDIRIARVEREGFAPIIHKEQGKRIAILR